MSLSQRYHVRHETIYRYGGNVAHSHQLLHLTARDSPHQRCLSRRLLLDPEPNSRTDITDAFGNAAIRLEYDQPHERLEVRAELDVEVRAPGARATSGSFPWPETRAALTYHGAPLSAELLDACRYRMESSFVSTKGVFVAYGEDCFTPARPLLDAATDLMRKIHRDFRYSPGSTSIRTSAAEAFAARRGVCQDFAHVMIACLRARGLAARYVSGYLRTLPPPDAGPSWMGADASHAWVSVYCPPLGWVDLDPTNDIVVGTDHIVIGWGRDFGDVSPLRGIIIGGGRHSLSVRVSTQTA